MSTALDDAGTLCGLGAVFAAPAEAKENKWNNAARNESPLLAAKPMRGILFFKKGTR
jgi:hypothetical protein